MSHLVNLILAWLATGCALACGIVWGLKFLAKWDHPLGQWSLKWNKKLRKAHIFLGVTAVQTGLFHGLLSSENVFSLNLGTALWVLLIVIGLTFMWRKSLSRWSGWLYWHRALTLAIGILIVVHVVDVGGITIHEVALKTIMPENTVVQNNQVVSPTEAGLAEEELGAQESVEVDLEEFEEAEDLEDTENLDIEDINETPEIKVTEPPAQVDLQKKSTEVPKVQTPKTKVSVNTEAITQKSPQATESLQKSEPAASVVAPENKNAYKDGVYTGEADGYRPGLVVEVTVTNGKIADIQVVSHNERGERFYGPPIAIIPGAIIDSQSTQVDSITGATYTSLGIMTAVENALKLAH